MEELARKYQFVRVQKGIMFSANGQSLAVIRSCSLHQDTLAKMSEGLNHFLEYLMATDKESYMKIGSWIFRKVLIINQDIRYLKENLDSYNENRLLLIHKHIIPDMFIMELICKYVADVSKADINEDDATTEVTLRNIDCSIVHALAMMIKFTYVFTFDIRGDLKYDEILKKYLDDILSIIITVSEPYFDYPADRAFDVEYYHSYIINFMHELYRKQWQQNGTKFQAKFEEVGKDVVNLSFGTMLKIFAALRKYVPPLLDLDNPKFSYIPEKDRTTVYWNINQNWRDFGFVNMNLVGYIRNTISQIIKRQDTKSPIPNVNIPDFIQDSGADDGFVNKEYSLYYDKRKHMYIASKPVTLQLFKDTLRAIDALDEEKEINLAILRDISLSSEHIMNNFILNKILLALTGDCRVYVEQLGAYAKFLLLLFYERIMRDPDLDFFKSIAQTIVMTPTQVPLYDANRLQELISGMKLGDISVDAVGELMPVYTKGEYSVVIDSDTVVDFYVFLSNPSRIRNLLFPTLYADTDTDDTTFKRDRDPNKFEEPILEGILNKANEKHGSF